MFRILIGLVALSLIAGHSQLAGAQSTPPVNYTQITRPVVEITDPRVIEYLLFELIIEPLQPPTKLQVIDITMNGYGPDDIIVVYPTVEAFLIEEFLPDSVQAVMSSWVPEVEFRLDSGNLPAAVLAALLESDADSSTRAENAILNEVVQAVERNYRDLPLGLLFRRDSLGFTFQLWDYDRLAMRFAPRPAYTADSSVAEVLALLKGTGYLQGGRGAGVVSGLDRSPVGLASLEQALLGIRTLPDDRTRQLAARTFLLGAFDFDRSGSIDSAREIDALSCEVWFTLDQVFQDGLDRFGFADPAQPYYGNVALSINENVRTSASRRRRACLEGRSPDPTSPDEVGEVTRPPLPEPVAEFLALETAAAIAQRAGGEEPNSATWAAAVYGVLVGAFDRNGSGQLDTAREVYSIPCDVWAAVRATHPSFAADFGFEGGNYRGELIGIAPSQRDAAAGRIADCGARAEPTVPRRVTSDTPTEGDAGQAYSTAAALAGIRLVEEHRRELAARTLLLAAYDRDLSGYIDTPAELDAISCEDWRSLDTAFPGFVQKYGFSVRAGGDREYRGGMVFNISERLRVPATRRVTACLRGEVPVATSETDVDRSGPVVRLPVSLTEFLDTQIAAQVVHATDRTVPGSATWAASVSAVLISTFDADRSGMLDRPDEIDAISCVVWNTVQATSGNTMSALGFDPSMPYLGDRIGVAEGQRARVARRLAACVR